MLTSIGVAAHAQEGPSLSNKVLYANQVNYRGTNAPDDKSRSVLFDGLRAKVLPHGDAPPIDIKSMPLRIGVVRAQDGATLAIDIRGAARCEASICLIALWLAGQTTMIEVSNEHSGDFFRHIEVQLPATEESYQSRLTLVVERATSRPDLEPDLVIDSLDLAIKHDR
jgi:hypothetical protein